MKYCRCIRAKRLLSRLSRGPRLGPHVMTSAIVMTSLLAFFVCLRQNSVVYTHYNGDVQDWKMSRHVQPNASSLTLPRTRSVILAGIPKPKIGYLTIGIPTLSRPKGDYLFNTLASLLQESTPAQQANLTLVLMVADRNATYNADLLQRIKAKYPHELRRGVMLVVSAPDTEELFNDRQLKRTYNDSLQRVRWRSKQNLDYAALMEVSGNLSEYYMQLEDDVTAAPNYLLHVQNFISSQRKPWALLELSKRGFIGKLVHSLDLSMFWRLLRTFYLQMPCDFLLGHFSNLLLQSTRIVRPGTLFFHQGTYSSLDENKPRKTDKKNRKLVGAVPTVVKNFRNHSNPRAAIFTSTTVFNSHVVANAYNLQSQLFFWAKDTKQGDFVTVVFRDPQCLRRVIIETGLLDEQSRPSRDRIQNATVELGTRAYQAGDGGPSHHPAAITRALCTDTTQIGKFKDGRFDEVVTLDPEVKCMSILMTQAHTQWVVIREIIVFTKDKE